MQNQRIENIVSQQRTDMDRIMLFKKQFYTLCNRLKAKLIPQYFADQPTGYSDCHNI